MPPTPSPKILAFVEGTMERLFINNNFHYVEVVSLSNGSGWSVAALCRQIGSKYAVKGGNPDHILVWLDMEKQSCSPESFRAAIIAELAARGADLAKIAICLPNRMTENIILADDEMIRKEFSNNYHYCDEGNHGKNVLSGMFRASGKHYRETFDGLSLLKRVRLARAAKKSKCVSDFLADFKVGCWWITPDVGEATAAI